MLRLPKFIVEAGGFGAVTVQAQIRDKRRPHLVRAYKNSSRREKAERLDEMVNKLILARTYMAPKGVLDHRDQIKIDEI